MQFESDAAIEQEYQEHQKNLSSLKHSIVDNIDHALHSAITETQEHAKDTVTTDAQQNMSVSDVNNIATGQSSKHELGYGINKSAMDATRRDLDAMHHTDPEGFERIGTKIEETFGASALTDDGPDPSQYNLKRFHR